MRLTDQQISGIVQALTTFIKAKAELRLYGSRVRDDLKGGDIDLLLIIFDEKLASELAQQKHYLLAAMKKQIGDQKIDFKIVDNKEIGQDSFVQMILPESVILYEWMP